MTEQEIIATFLKAAGGSSNEKSVVVGPGVDAAVLKMNGNLVVSTDLSVEGVHFDLGLMTPEQAGRRAIVLAAPDVICQGALPEFVFLSGMLPMGADSKLIKGLAKGVAQGLKECGAKLMGGDTTRGPCVGLDVVVMGRRRRVFDYTKVRGGDWVGVTGSLGASCQEFRNLKMGNVLGGLAYKEPTPRFKLAEEIFGDKNIGLVTDVSDGLVKECEKIAGWLGMGVELDKSLLMGLNTQIELEDVLYGGEDGVFLVCGKGVPPPYIRQVGKMLESGVAVFLVEEGLKKKRMRHRGYQHFSG